ncbi:MAG: helix-turn-helix transcriptional regulator [Candidatus Brevundimonas phytovorans]|nr:AraC family transcriptional regulator [Brevundimonas sp.]WEK57444.1 MAG: helix-turn-helix transcriptional regulator [Brevundimonas sp.]
MASNSISWAVSTQTVPDAFERYVYGMADFYEVSGVSDHDRLNFYNETRTTVVDAGAIGYGRSVCQTLSRSPATLRRSDVDGLNLSVHQAAVVGDADGRSVRAAPGAVQLRDLSLPGNSRLERVDVIALIAPRAAVPACLLGRQAHGAVIAPDAPGARLLTAHLTSLDALAATLTDDEVEAAIQALLLVAARMTGFAVTLAPSEVTALQRSVRRQAKGFIETRLTAGDAAITSDAVAKAAGVSRASLYRAFDEDGGVTRYIQDRRLHHARRALRQRSGPAPTIADIAYAYGFASASHFSRQFRARFGYSPSDVEPLSPPRDVSLSDGPIRHEVLVQWLKSLPDGPDVA